MRRPPGSSNTPRFLPAAKNHPPSSAAARDRDRVSAAPTSPADWRANVAVQEFLSQRQPTCTGISVISPMVGGAYQHTISVFFHVPDLRSVLRFALSVTGASERRPPRTHHQCACK